MGTRTQGFSSPTGKLVIVGTPIGNLGDLSPRAREAFATADVVLAEDTRVTAKLLAHYDIHVPLGRCDENVIAKRAPHVMARIQNGGTVAFCSDAGMPCISDPGMVLVREANRLSLPVEVIPGPTAATTAIAASGLDAHNFYFGGFLPRKASEREKLLESLRSLPAALVFYESPYRVRATLESIARTLPVRNVCLARELTKLHEEEIIGTAEEILSELDIRGELKGEIVLVIEAPEEVEKPEAESEEIEEILSTGAKDSKIAKCVASYLDVPKRVVYDAMHGAEESDSDTQGTARAIMEAASSYREERHREQCDEYGDAR